MHPLLTSGGLSRATGLSEKAIRLYRAKGLLTPQRDSRSGFHYFSDDQVERARLIGLLRASGLPLEAVATVLDSPVTEMERAFEREWQNVNAAHADRAQLARYTRLRLSGATAAHFATVRRQVPTLLVLSESHSVTIAALSETIQTATARIFDVLYAANMPLADAPMVIYHGLVTEESDGLIEICVPIDDAVRPGAGMTLREEPAHELVAIRLTQEEASYPTIAAAHDQLSVGVGTESFTPIASNREMYFPNWGAAAAGEIVAEVAVPVAVPTV